jgi:putative transposase
VLLKVVRTEQMYLPHTNILSTLCHNSKNLYNEANYIVRQELFKTGKWTRYYTLAMTLRDSDSFKSLNAQSSQQTLKVLDRSWKSFFKAIKEWKIHPEKFLGRPKIPNYKPKDGESIIIFTNQQVSIRNGYLIFPKRADLKIQTRLADDTDISEVRIIPKGVGYVCEIVYVKNVEPLNLDRGRVATIDFGLSNIVTIANNVGEQPIIVKGGVMKSINQFYNKRRAELQSIYDKQNIKTGEKIKVLTTKRNAKIKDQMHKISHKVIEYCIAHNIGTIVIGHNENWKQNADLGKKNNQNFVSIPFYILTNQLQYKAEEIGNLVILQEESHTSKCSFIDTESIEHHETYIGKRVSRGLFRTAKGTIINADVNGSLNIGRKAIPKAFAKAVADGIEGVVLHPKRININGCDTF